MEAKRSSAKAMRSRAGAAGVAVLESRPTIDRRPSGSGAHHDDALERNPGTPLDLDVVRALRVNRSAVERRASTIPTRRTVKKQWQAAWLLRAITCIDLTTLSGDDTPSNVLRLCAKAKHPVRPRSEERRVGKEGRSRGGAGRGKKK